MSKVRVINSSGQVKFVAKRIADNERLLNKYGWIVQDFDVSNKDEVAVTALITAPNDFEAITDTDIKPTDEPIDLFESKEDKKIKQGKK